MGCQFFSYCHSSTSKKVDPFQWSDILQARNAFLIWVAPFIYILIIASHNYGYCIHYLAFLSNVRVKMCKNLEQVIYCGKMNEDRDTFFSSRHEVKVIQGIQY